jgi:hypothetical protein
LSSASISTRSTQETRNADKTKRQRSQKEIETSPSKSKSPSQSQNFSKLSKQAKSIKNQSDENIISTMRGTKKISKPSILEDKSRIKHKRNETKKSTQHIEKSKQRNQKTLRDANLNKHVNSGKSQTLASREISLSVKARKDKISRKEVSLTVNKGKTSKVRNANDKNEAKKKNTFSTESHSKVLKGAGKGDKKSTRNKAPSDEQNDNSKIQGRIRKGGGAKLLNKGIKVFKANPVKHNNSFIE